MKTRNALYSVSLMAVAVTLLLNAAPAKASQTDDRIDSAALKSYVFKTYLKDDAITVSSKDGVVTLTGTVNEESHKLLAKETLAGLPGVKSVDDRLVLKGESPPVNSDAWINEKVIAALRAHRDVRGIKNEVNVKDGIVTLRGEADSQEQKNLDTEYVSDVLGVKEVKNEMTTPGTPEIKVKKTTGKKTIAKKIDTIEEKIDDASITGLVKMTLLYHRSTSALDTRVQTNNGAVTLSGIAKNENEKALASKYAKAVHGVKSVNNQMTIN